MSPTISVKFATISREECQQVLDHYNSIKPSHFMVLEELDRCEGGFQLALNTSELALNAKSDVNNQIKQLRWNRRKLDPSNYIGFDVEETMLLYRSLVHVFGESFVVLL